MNLIRKFFTTAAFVVAGIVSVSAQAAPVTLDFEGVAANGVQSACPLTSAYSQGGYSLGSASTFCNHYIGNNLTGNNIYGNTTSVMAICSGCNGGLLLTLTGPAAFSALSVDIGSLYGSNPEAITFTGYFVGGGSVVQAVDGAQRWATYLLNGFTGLSSMTIQTGVSGAHASLDNIVVTDANTVPEPTSIALLGLALVAAGAARRRKAA